MKFTLKKLDLEKSFGNLSKASQLKSEALVVASHQLADSKKKKLSGLVASFDELLGGVINDLVNDENFKFKTGETVSLRLSGSERAAFALGPIKKLILVGLGEEKDFDKKSEDEEKRKEFGAGIKGDMTGRNQAFDAFNLVQTYFSDAYLDLNNPEDIEMYKKWGLYNIKLLLDKYESELNTNPDEPNIENPT